MCSLGQAAAVSLPLRKGASGGREMERGNDCAERNLLLVSKFVLTTNQSLVGFTSLGPSPVEMACPFLVWAALDLSWGGWRKGHCGDPTAWGGGPGAWWPALVPFLLTDFLTDLAVSFSLPALGLQGKSCEQRWSLWREQPEVRWVEAAEPDLDRAAIRGWEKRGFRFLPWERR